MKAHNCLQLVSCIMFKQLFLATVILTFILAISDIWSCNDLGLISMKHELITSNNLMIHSNLLSISTRQLQPRLDKLLWSLKKSNSISQIRDWQQSSEGRVPEPCRQVANFIRRGRSPGGRGWVYTWHCPWCLGMIVYSSSVWQWLSYLSHLHFLSTLSQLWARS